MIPTSERPSAVGRAWLAPGAWLAAWAALALFIARRFDLFRAWLTVTMPDGARVRLPNSWATVDHPFHVARAETLRRALADGGLLRWIGHHQGGYPIEFYPLGAAWLDVGLWAALLGQVPMAAVHKILIWLIVLAPSVAYLWWARQDRLSPGIALLAGAGHAVVSGWWWSGGWMEVALWGLVTNVAAQTASLFVLGGCVAWLRRGTRRALAVAVIAGAFAIGTNPRTFVGLGVIGVSALVVSLIDAERPGTRPLAGRVGALIGLTALLAAPEVLSLARYNGLYFFVHYSGYGGVGAWWKSSIQAVSGPFFVAALAGCLLGLALPGRPATRAAAIALILYGGATAALAGIGGGFVEQLELTRLMPFQRMLMFYLAAVAVHDTVRAGAAVIGGRGERALTGAALAALALLTVSVYAFGRPALVPVSDRGLQPIPTSAEAPIADLEAAVRLADQQAQPGTAILILGSALSWHAPLWAPMWSDRPFFYDDWLWYWQKKHYGAYNPDLEHAYPRDDSTLNADYFGHHGIGAVIVTGEARAEAAASPLLQSVRPGPWYDVYLVRAPVSIVTENGVGPAQIDVENQTLTAHGAGKGGTLTIRRNWFPRWRATVNGQDVPITQTADGYMTVPVPAGEYDLRLTYGLTALDWLGRGAFVVGLALTLGLLVVGNRREWKRGRAFARPRRAAPAVAETRG